MKKTVKGNFAELKIMPGRLTKLVAEGKAKIIGKDKFGRRLYEIDADVHSREACQGTMVSR